MMQGLPNMAVMAVPGLMLDETYALALDAAKIARRYAPKLTVASSSSFYPLYGSGWFGIGWSHPYVWFQERGIQPFTMNSAAGKTIPMWINDPTGEEQRKNPKAKTRRTADGRTQVLIFRRAAKHGQRRFKTVRGRLVSVPASYPGASGRIAVNRSQGLLRQRDVAPGVGNPGWIAKGNVGVRWRHPGLNPKRFLSRGLIEACGKRGIVVQPVVYRRSASVAPFTPLVVEG